MRKDKQRILELEERLAEKVRCISGLIMQINEYINDVEAKDRVINELREKVEACKEQYASLLERYISMMERRANDEHTD